MKGPAVVLVVLVTAACGGSGAKGSGAKGAGGSRLEGAITVAAAASLREAFTELGRSFERAHPGIRVRFSFDASSSLAAQIVEGAPADVFAAADPVTMRRVVQAGEADGRPRSFARNRLEIVTRRGNPDRVRSLRDLTRVGTVSLCVATAPCGRLAGSVLRRARVRVPESRISRGPNAADTLAAVSLGDADAGLVYVTDVRVAGRAVTGVPIPARENGTTTYQIAVVRETQHRAVARLFLADVRSSAGARVLRARGFLPA